MNANIVLTNAIEENNALLWNKFNTTNIGNGLVITDFEFDKNFSRANKSNKFKFRRVLFSNCSFSEIRLSNTSFNNSTFQDKTIFRSSIFMYSNFEGSMFKSCLLEKITFRNCHLNKSNFIHDTKINNCDFYGSSLIGAKFLNSKITNTDVYGANMWDLKHINSNQKDILISNKRSTSNEIDSIKLYDLELAHLINLLKNNRKFASLFDESKSKFVLILGRFGDHLEVLLKIKERITLTNKYVPILFDWDTCESQLDLLETIQLLAGLSKFIIVDLTSPNSVPAELQAILSNIMIPVIPILKDNQREFGVYSFTNKYNWVNGIIKYDTIDQILSKFNKAIIKPAEKMSEEIKKIKQFKIKSIHIEKI